MYTALYRAYRPEVFDEVLGQEHIIRILRNQIATDSTSHAYLFCGTRGTGKTTSARLLAKGLNCLSDGEKPCGECSNCRAISEGSFIDVIEIDAASNNGVDNIRELRESVNYPPAAGRKKIYIIDEVHMLSTGAFNALLKTLEEPPEYVVFILATTEVQKLPATILSRCMRLDFKRVPEKTLISGMAEICGRIGIDVSEDALRIIAANADGSVRDGLSILDQCISGGDKRVGEKDVLEFLGASSDEDFIELTDMIRKRRTSDAIEFLSDILSDGKDVRQFMRDWTNHYRNLLMTKYIREPQAVLNMSTENIERIRRQSSVFELDDINRGILELSRTMNEARWSTQPRILLELAMVKLCLGAGEIKQYTELKKVNEPVQADEVSIATTTGAAKAVTVEENAAGAAVPESTKEQNPAETDAGSEKTQNVESEEGSAAENKFGIADGEFDCEEIWDEVFREGEAEKGSFFLIRKGGTLTSIDGDEFTVVVSSELLRDHAEKNRRLLEELVSKNTGRNMRMRLCMKDLRDEKTSADKIAEKAKDILNVDVSID